MIPAIQTCKAAGSKWSSLQLQGPRRVDDDLLRHADLVRSGSPIDPSSFTITGAAALGGVLPKVSLHKREQLFQGSTGFAGREPCRTARSPAPTPFIHLRAHSAYSPLEGAVPVKKLAQLALDNGMPAVALTDSGNLFGALEFSEAAGEAGVQPIIGATMRVALADQAEGRRSAPTAAAAAECCSCPGTRWLRQPDEADQPGNVLDGAGTAEPHVPVALLEAPPG